MNADLSQDRPEDFLNDPKTNKVVLPPINIEMVTSEKLNAKNKVANLNGEDPYSTDEYMRTVTEKAKEANSQLCVTGNAFNKLFDGKV